MTSKSSRHLLDERAIGILSAVVTALCWAVLAIGLKMALKYTDSGTIVWMRMVIASAVLLIGYLVTSPGQLRILKHLPLLGLLAGVCLAANYFGYMKGVELTSPSNAQIMIQAETMALIVIGIFYFKERPSPLQGLGFVIASLGFGLFFWDQIRVAVANQAHFIEGNLWIAMAAVTWAVFATCQKILTKLWTPQQINLLIYLLSTIVLAPLADFSNLTTWSWTDHGLMLFLGLNTVLAYGALGEALKRIPASQASVIIAANPLLTIAIMTFLRYQKVQWIEADLIDWRGYLGSALVVVGVIFAVRQPKDQSLEK